MGEARVYPVDRFQGDADTVGQALSYRSIEDVLYTQCQRMILSEQESRESERTPQTRSSAG